MRISKLLVLLPLLGIYACNNTVTKLQAGLLATDSLPKQNYSINIYADTLLQTAGGAWLKIEKGTFTAENGTATIEIREAYSVEQIVKAGLVTTSNGVPLSSGGMIYINAAAGQKITINKPFKLALPSSALDSKMELYKGEKNQDGTINWNNPVPIDSNSQLTAIQKGEVLFRQKCASCHGIGKEGSGPDLANLYRRFGTTLDGEGTMGYYDHRFAKRHTYTSAATTILDGKIIENSDSVHSYVDAYECNLISLFGDKAIDLSKDFNFNYADQRLIYDYIENESRRLDLPDPKHAYLKASTDSCRMYELSKKIKAQLLTKKQKEIEIQQALIEANGPLVDKRPDSTWQSNSNIPPPGFSEKVTPNNYNAVYYQFTIESFGWYNIDMLLNKKEGVAQSELFVRVAGAIREKIKIYLVIPSAKVYGEGGPSEQGADVYSFFNKDDSIPLPQNSRAYILAVTETEKSIAFGVKEFITQTKQSFELSLQESTKKEFDAAIKKIDAAGFSVTVAESKNAAAIRQSFKTILQLEQELQQLEKLKPKLCDCECGSVPPAETFNEVVPAPPVKKNDL